MRKILPSILILLIIVNIFAPFSVRMDKNKLSLKKNVADAAIMNVTVTQTKATENSIELSFNIQRETTDYHGVYFVITPTQGTKLVDQVEIGQNNFRTLDSLVSGNLAQTTLTSAEKVFKLPSGVSGAFTKLSNNILTDPPIVNINGKEFKNTVYKFTMTSALPNTTYYLSMWSFNGNTVPEGVSSFLDKPIKTSAVGQTDNTPVEVGQVNTTGPDSALPQCWISITEGWSMSGCIAQFIYYFFFVPTSFLFALTGVFFDWTFYYSIQDGSYTSSFVVEGWGVVRDFCNIFFIFVLLYIAFREILGFSGGHGPNTKQLIINVVIIGLLINFSLFASQMIVDASNILARVFYNSNSIKITKNGANGVTNSTPQINQGPNGELQLSAALVNKVNPQNLIIQAKQVGNIKDEAGKSNDSVQSNTGVSNGTFILVTILAIAVNIVGMIVFLSVGLIFIARVIGIWIYMIFAPLAFFSYTVPQMQGLPMVGWRNWWSELLSMSFLAPIFIFFLYLILKFLETGFDLIGAQNKDGMQFVIATVVPFAFIMILLIRAKKIAQKLSGEMGQGITGGIAAAGGLALGGAALGAAFLGRNLIGGTMARASRGETATQKYEQGTAKGIGKVTGFIGSTIGLGKLYGQKNQQTGTVTGGLGGYLNKKQKHVGDIDHARHEMDSIKDKAGLKGVDDDKLSGVDVQKMQTTFTKEKKGEIEADIRKGAAPLVDGGGNPIRDTSGAIITGGESGYKSAMRSDVSHRMGLDPNNVDYATGELTDAAKKKVEDELNVNFNAILKTSTDKESTNRFNHLRGESKEKVNPYDRIVSRSNKSSYDIRNLSQTKSDKREGIFTRMGAGLIAGVAMGVRTGLKNSKINHGSGQSDLLKDLGHTITEALKSAQFNVKVESSHGGGGHDDHGGGHH